MVDSNLMVRGTRRAERPPFAYVASLLSTSVQVQWNTGAGTAAAEAGLRIDPPCIYWYIRRVHHALNGVVLFHRVARERLLPAERGACPYDTGALWSGNTIRAGMTDDQKRACFIAHDRSIADGLDAFVPWIGKNYSGNAAGYHAGARPSVDIPEIVAAVSPDAPWAPWAWEVRVAKARVHDVMLPVRVVWRRADSEAFDLWLSSGSSGLDALAQKELAALVSHIELLCADDESAYDRAVRYIAEAP